MKEPLAPSDAGTNDFTAARLRVPTRIAEHVWPEGTVPVVSVCCVTYNHEKYIREAVEGFLGQIADFRIEILIHDDASTDATADIIREYEGAYPGLIRTILRADNQYSLRGYAFVGDLFAMAKGKYIANCEGDDYWSDPLKLQKQIDLMDADPDCVLSFHPCFFRTENQGEAVVREQDKASIVYPYDIENLLVKWGIPTASMVFRNILPPLPSWFSKIASGDIAVAMFLYERGTFRCLDDRMSVYRITGHGASISHHGARMIHYRAYLYAKVNEYFSHRYEDEIYRALLKLIERHTAEEAAVSERAAIDGLSLSDLLWMVARKSRARVRRLLSG